MKKAIYAGSFDPITNGHLWVIKKACGLFDHLTIAVGLNPGKKYSLDAQKRLEMIDLSLKEVNIQNASTTLIENKLLVQYAQTQKIPYLVRGIRSPDDFNYEFAMRQINRELSPSVESVYLIPPANMAQISSSMVKGLVGLDNWEEAAARYVPSHVLNELKALI